MILSPVVGAQETAADASTAVADEISESVWKKLGLPEPNPDAPYAKPPQLELLFEDDFSTDTRGDYEIDGKEGAVTWQPGKLTLSDGARLTRQIEGDNWVELELDLEFPELTEDGQKSELKLLLDLDPQTDSCVVFHQERTDGVTRSEITLFDIPAPDPQGLALGMPQKVYSVRLDHAMPTGNWKVSYCGGLWKVLSPESSVNLTGYIVNGHGTVCKLVATVSSAPLVIRQIGGGVVPLVEHGFSPADERTLQRTEELNKTVLELLSGRQAAAAIPMARESLEIRLRMLGQNHSNVATSLYNLALVYVFLGRAADAEPLHEEALAIRRRVFPNDHPHLALSLNNLAIVRQSLGRGSEAEPFFEEALAMRRRLFPGDHPAVAEGLNNLAHLRISLGQSAKAEPLFEEAVAMLRRLFPGNHPDMATGLNNLAAVRKSLGRTAEAEQLYEEALAMFRRLFPGDHPNVATSLNNLAGVRMQLGRLTEAEPLMEETLSMLRRLIHGDHPSVATSLNNLANLRQSLGRSAEAEPLLEEAVAMFRRLFPGDHPAVATGLTNLAAVRRSLGRSADAEPLLEEALVMVRRLFPGDHPDVAVSLSVLASVRESLDRVAEAEPLHEEALAMWQRINPGDHPSVATGLNNVATVQRSLGRVSEAEPLLEEALAMYLRLFPGDHIHVAGSLSNLASVRQSLGRAVAAEQPNEEALAMFRRLFPGDHPNVATGLSNLAITRQALGRTEEAEPLYEEALAMIERMRTQVRGEALERAAYSGKLEMSEKAQLYASVLVTLQKSPRALGVLERGTTRAGLDLFAGGRTAAEQAFLDSASPEDRATHDAALAAETEARAALLEAEKRMALAPNAEKKVWFDRVTKARANRSDKTSAVFNHLRGLVPQLNPLSTDEILAALDDGQGLITWAWVDNGPVVLIAFEGQVHGFRLAENADETRSLTETLSSLRQAISARPASSLPLDPSLITAARPAILSPEAREALSQVRTLIAVPAGPVQRIPLELLIDDLPIAYAPSATIAINRQQAARTRSEIRTSAVVLGNPSFRGAPVPEKKYPETGTLLVMVQEGSNGAKAGLSRGDVLLQYGNKELKSQEDLPKAIAAAAESSGDSTIPVRIWRDGEEMEVKLPPGQMGVQLSNSSPVNGLRSMEVLDRSGDELAARVSAQEQFRLYGGVLPPLPGTQLEAVTVASVFGNDAALLLGNEASAPNLNEAVQHHPPRVLHLATHGLMGSSERPLLASLALTTPAEPTPGDTGFVTLEDILSTWGSRLKGTELVVLSACDTARGVQQGDTSMALPLGLFICGAETVIASQWKVDDTATALLMSRFYANWLGKTDSERVIDGVTYAPGQSLSKLAALREAQAWLRGLKSEQVATITAAMSETDGAMAVTQFTRGGDDELADATSSDFPFAHPYYWSAFVLYGSPE